MRLYGILVILLLYASVFSSDLFDHFSLTFVESEQYVNMKEEVIVFYNVTCSLDNLRGNNDTDSWQVAFTVGDESLAEITSGSPSPTVQEMCNVAMTSSDGSIENNTFIFNLTVRGLFLGATTLKASLEPTSGQHDSQHLDQTDLLVLFSPTNVERILGYILLSLNILNNFWWGTQIDFSETKKIIRKPTAIILTLGLQFLFLPTVSITICFLTSDLCLQAEVCCYT